MRSGQNTQHSNCLVAVVTLGKAPLIAIDNFPVKAKIWKSFLNNSLCESNRFIIFSLRFCPDSKKKCMVYVSLVAIQAIFETIINTVIRYQAQMSKIRVTT